MKHTTVEEGRRLTMFFQPYVHVGVGSPMLLQRRIVIIKGVDECNDNGKEPGAVRRASDVSRGPGEVPLRR